MKLYSLALLLGFYCSQTRGDSDSPEAGSCCETGFCYGNLYSPIITILCLALLLSIAVNVYYICMRKYRESCQNCYDDHIDDCCCCDSTNACEQPDAETQAQHSAVSVSSEIIECEDHADKRAVDCVYSAVKVNVKAPADTRHSATSDSSGIQHCEDHHSDTRHSAVSVSSEIWECEDQADESAIDCVYSAVKLNEKAPADTRHSSGSQNCEDRSTQDTL